ncbi:MAG: SCO family protein [Vulcanimicrobiota bacterium]
MALVLYIFWAVTWLAWVLLALAPVPELSPEWILLTREVCFGSLPDRLPTVQGWISLAAPIPMLIALVMISGDELKRQMRALNRPFLIFLLLLPVFTIGYAAFRVEQERLVEPVLEEEYPALPPGYPTLNLELPRFSLTDQDGRAVEETDLQGEVTVLTFAYAHCQTVCPRLLNTMRELEGVPRVVVTLDPWRDTCGNLSGIANLWDLGPTRVLSGEPEEIARLTDALDVPVSRDQKTGEIYHPALVFILDREGRVAYGFTDPPVEWVREGVDRLNQP